MKPFTWWIIFGLSCGLFVSWPTVGAQSESSSKPKPVNPKLELDGDSSPSGPGERRPDRSQFECKKYGDRELAQAYLEFVAYGGLLSGWAKCPDRLKNLPFYPLEPFEGEGPREWIRIRSLEDVQIVSVKRIMDGDDWTRVLEVKYRVRTPKGQWRTGVMEISPSLSQTDLDVYGCAYNRLEPQPGFILRECWPPSNR